MKWLRTKAQKSIKTAITLGCVGWAVFVIALIGSLIFVFQMKQTSIKKLVNSKDLKLLYRLAAGAGVGRENRGMVMSV